MVLVIVYIFPSVVVDIEGEEREGGQEERREGRGGGRREGRSS